MYIEEVDLIKIHYISYYLNQDEVKGRNLEVAAQSKIGYLVGAMKRAGAEVTVVSTATTMNGEGFSHYSDVNVDPHERHIYLAALGTANVITKKLRILYMQFALFIYLLTRVKRNDVVVIYHSLRYIPVVTLIKRMTKYKVVLEFNDLYALHFIDQKKVNSIRVREQAYVKMMDGFVLASPFMAEIVDNMKPAIISYGSYDVDEIEKSRYFDDHHIRVVYSGVIENLRGAANLIASASLHLSDDYVIHIAGYGRPDVLVEFKDVCESINRAKGYTAIVYHGLLLNERLKLLLEDCDIALNCHKYSDEDLWKSRYSFPSKIPLNMGFGLYMVSHSMDVVRESPFAECISFFDAFTPQAVADAIKQCVDMVKNDQKGQRPKQLMRKLDEAFVTDMNDFIFSIQRD
ncbi:MAG: glycosyltransferase family protein [Armatimonadota bacterium]